jgi:hypothetical protein
VDVVDILRTVHIEASDMRAVSKSFPSPQSYLK